MDKIGLVNLNTITKIRDIFYSQTRKQIFYYSLYKQYDRIGTVSRFASHSR